MTPRLKGPARPRPDAVACPLCTKPVDLVDEDQVISVTAMPERTTRHYHRACLAAYRVPARLPWVDGSKDRDPYQGVVFGQAGQR